MLKQDSKDSGYGNVSIKSSPQQKPPPKKQFSESHQVWCATYVAVSMEINLKQSTNLSAQRKSTVSKFRPEPKKLKLEGFLMT